MLHPSSDSRTLTLILSLQLPLFLTQAHAAPQVLQLVLRVGSRLPVHELLRRCGGWPGVGRVRRMLLWVELTLPLEGLVRLGGCQGRLLLLRE